MQLVLRETVAEKSEILIYDVGVSSYCFLFFVVKEIMVKYFDKAVSRRRNLGRSQAGVVYRRIRRIIDVEIERLSDSFVLVQMLKSNSIDLGFLKKCHFYYFIYIGECSTTISVVFRIPFAILHSDGSHLLNFFSTYNIFLYIFFAVLFVYYFFFVASSSISCWSNFSVSFF